MTSSKRTLYKVENPRRIAEGVRIFHSKGKDYYAGDVVGADAIDADALEWLIERGILVKLSGSADRG